MTTSTPHLVSRTVAMPVEFLTALERAAHDPANPLTIDSVRDAGFRAGQALFDAFGDWTLDRGSAGPEELSHHQFITLASEFFAELGWGELVFTTLSDAVVAIDTDAWSTDPWTSDSPSAHGTPSQPTPAYGTPAYGTPADGSVAMGLGGEDLDRNTAGGCLVTTGMLAGFIGRLAEAPLAVLEVECRDAGANRCRFLLGSIDVLAYVHEAVERGIPYERAALSA